MSRSAIAAMAALVVAAIGSIAEAADDFPTLKAGRWELATRTSTQKPGDPPLASSMCLDDATSREMSRFSQGMMDGMCSRFEVRRSGSRYTSEATCTLGGSKMLARSTMTMSGDAAYRIEGRSTYDPPFLGIAEATTTVDARHTGPCAPGQKPGDVTTAGGQTINIRSLSKAGRP